MIIHDGLTSWTVSTAHHEPHTWVPSWTPPALAELRDDVLTAGWDWKLVDAPPTRASRRKRRCPQLDSPFTTEPGNEETVAQLRAIAAWRYQKLRTPRRQPPRRTLLAIGPNFNGHNPDLLHIARLGRSTGIHLAVATDLAEPHRTPQELIDNIHGYWECCTVTTHPSGGVSIRLKRTRPVRRERLDDTVTVGVDNTGAATRIDLASGLIADIDAILGRYGTSISRPTAQLLRERFCR